MASFAIAVERAFKDKTTGNRPVDFINCTAWRQTGEMIARYFKKGQLIGIDGRLEVRQYDGKDGTKKTAYEIQVDSFSFCGSSGDGAQRQTQNTQADAPEPPRDEQTGFEEVRDDELPFDYRG